MMIFAKMKVNRIVCLIIKDLIMFPLGMYSLQNPRIPLSLLKKRINNLDTPASEVQVGIHELLGHGTGKLFQEHSNGELNFHPLTGGKITSWYKPGETWDSKVNNYLLLFNFQFQSLASTMEKCRAECVGIYLSTNLELLSIFGHTGQEALDIFYINWLIMVRGNIRDKFT
jgi:hypothetical protein